MHELRELYEKHLSQGETMVTVIMDAWKSGLETGRTMRLLKIRSVELFASGEEDLAFPESLRDGVFCGWEYVTVHCPHCDKYKLVSRRIHNRIILCDKCQKVYFYSLENTILLRYKKISEEKCKAIKKDRVLEIAEKQGKITELEKEIGDGIVFSRNLDELLLLEDAVRSLEEQLKYSEQLMKS